MASPQNENYHWTQHFNSRKAAVKTAKSNPQLLAFTGAVGAAGAAEAAKDRAPKKYQKKIDTTADAVYGAAAGQAAYQLSGYGTKKANAKVNDPKLYADPKRRRGYTKTEYKKKVEAAKKEYGLRDPNRKPDFKNYSRNFPKDVPGGRLTRVLGHTHGGNRGVAVGAAATAAGAALAVKAGKKKDDKVSKHAGDPFEISKVSMKLKVVAGAKRGLYDSLGVTKPKMREAAYAGNGPVKSKLYNAARTKVRRKTEQPLKDLAQSRPVRQAALRMVKEDATKKAKAAGHKLAPVAVGAGLGGAVVGGTATYKRKEIENKAKKVSSPFAKNLSQEQIDRRKKIQAASSKTTATLGLTALGAQGIGAAVSRGKLRKLPGLRDGKLVVNTVTKPKKTGAKIKSATTPLLATSAGVGAVSGFNFASYTKAEANQKKKAIPAQ